MRRILFAALLLLPACSTLPRPAAQTAAGGEAGLAPPAQSDLYLGVVDGLIRQQRYQAAIAFLAKYQKNGAATPRFRILAGDALAGAGRIDEAIASYRGALQSDRAALAYDGIGKAEGARGQWGAAAENFRRASQLDPADPAYLNNLGYAQLKQNFTGGDLGRAADALERAHELAPDSARIRNNLALAAARAARPAQLLTLLDTIPDPADRKRVADFTANWNPGAAETGTKKGFAP